MSAKIIAFRPRATRPYVTTYLMLEQSYVTSTSACFLTMWGTMRWDGERFCHMDYREITDRLSRARRWLEDKRRQA
jgi:hypothetical protein